MLSQAESGYIKLGKVSTVYGILGQVSLVQDRLEEIRSA